jgi:hypothetical protein
MSRATSRQDRRKRRVHLFKIAGYLDTVSFAYGGGVNCWLCKKWKFIHAYVSEPPNR